MKARRCGAYLPLSSTCSWGRLAKLGYQCQLLTLLPIATRIFSLFTYTNSLTPTLLTSTSSRQSRYQATFCGATRHGTCCHVYWPLYLRGASPHLFLHLCGHTLLGTLSSFHAPPGNISSCLLPQHSSTLFVRMSLQQPHEELLFSASLLPSARLIAMSLLTSLSPLSHIDFLMLSPVCWCECGHRGCLCV